MARKLLIGCGVLSALLYVALNVVGPLRFVGYSAVSQTVSELSAIGAPTRPLWLALGTLYTALVIAFGWGIWESARRNRPLRVVGAVVLANGILSLAWPFASMHPREVLAAGGGTFSDVLHLVLGGLSVALMLAAMGFGAAAFGRRFRVYSIATIAVAAVFGVLTGLDGPRVGRNLPTPWLGVWERINIGVYLLWVVVLAVLLWRTRISAPDRPRRSRPAPARRGGDRAATAPASERPPAAAVRDG